MKFVRLQLHNEIRHHWPMVVFWALALGIHCIDQMQPLQIVAPMMQGVRIPLWMSGLHVVLFLFIAVFPAFVLLSDSPANPDSHMRTRPMPITSFLCGKVLFLGLFVVLPAIIQEAAFLWFQNLRIGFIVHAAIERGLYLMPIVLSIAAFATLWRNIREWTVGMVLYLAIGFGLVVKLMLLAEWNGNRNFLDPDHLSPMQFLAGLWMLAIALMIVAWLNLRRNWSVWHRFIYVVLAGYIALIATGFWPWDIKLSPSEPEWVAQNIKPSHIQIPDANLQVSKIKSWKNSQEIWCQVIPEIEAELDRCVVHWETVDCRLITATGKTLQRPKYFEKSRPLGYRTYSNKNEDAGIFEHMLGFQGTVNSDGASWQGKSTLFLGRFPYTDVDNPVRLNASLTGFVCRWEKVAALPFNDGLPVGDDFGQWRILWKNNNPSEKMIIWLQRNQLNLLTTRDPRAIRSRFEQYQFVLANPKTQQAWLADSYWWPQQSGLSGYSRNTLRLDFSARKELIERTSIDDFQLLVFCKRYLGKIDYPFASSPITVPPLDQNSGSGALQQAAHLPRHEFDKKFKQLKPPQPQCSRQELGRYLAEVIQLLEARRYHSIDENDSVIQILASYIPYHLPVFVDVIAEQETASSRIFARAVAYGMEEKQKSDILHELERNPSLIQVILARGWLDEAREQIYAAARSPYKYSFDLARAVAWFQDPKTYPQLLDQLIRRLEANLYDVVRILPGIEPQLDQAVEKIWKRRPRDSGRSVTPALYIGLRHGKQEAFRELHTTIVRSSSSESMNAYEYLLAFGKHVHLPEFDIAQIHDHAFLAAWIKRYKAEDFVFCPVRRQFVLKNSATTKS